MLKRLLSLLTGSSESSQSPPKTTAAPTHRTDWTFNRVDEQPYDHYTEAVEDVKQLKREKRHDEVEELLLWCIDYTEAESRTPETIESTPARAYYRHLGIVYRKDDRYEDEVEVLERYVDVCDELGRTPRDELVDRLERACELASGD